MLRERILRILLSLPLVGNLTELAIAIFIKKISLIDSSKLQFLNFRATNKFTNSKYFPTKKFHWIIQISAPSGPKSKLWGDTYFAEEIAHSLIKLDQEAEVVLRDQNILDFVKPNSIILNIRGLLPMTTVPGKLNLIWVISHPGQISKRELKKYDLNFAASTSWALQKSLNWNMKITPLLQATNPEIFNTKTGNAGINKNLLFIGNTRGVFRKSVKVANTKAKNLEVIGTGWQKFLPEKKIKQEFLSNSDLSREYREAGFVLSDHWDDMANNGFISNRIFDAAASGARIISDYVQGSSEIFGEALLEFQDATELEDLFNSDMTSKFGSQIRIDEIASSIQRKHNFDQRAQVLLNEASDFINLKN